jgi:hypothetical protein
LITIDLAWFSVDFYYFKLHYPSFVTSRKLSYNEIGCC